MWRSLKELHTALTVFLFSFYSPIIILHVISEYPLFLKK